MCYSKHEYKRRHSRSKTLTEATNVANNIYEACLNLFTVEPSSGLVHHVHVEVTNLVTDQVIQLDLFPGPQTELLQRMGRALESIQGRFGPGAMLSYLTQSGTAVNSLQNRMA
ncbi:hypothetical protein [Paenibacillus caui]|uniref:DinB/UmuC family translesion DNA polymerase n=1 Tax=Paenibacillus caui TaxID=2873927 RepID=UPI001CA88EA4